MKLGVYALLFTSETGLQESQVKTRGKIWSKEVVRLVEEDKIRECSKQTSMGPGRMHP